MSNLRLTFCTYSFWGQISEKKKRRKKKKKKTTHKILILDEGEMHTDQGEIFSVL